MEDRLRRRDPVWWFFVALLIVVVPAIAVFIAKDISEWKSGPSSRPKGGACEELLTLAGDGLDSMVDLGVFEREVAVGLKRVMRSDARNYSETECRDALVEYEQMLESMQAAFNQASPTP